MLALPVLLQALGLLLAASSAAAANVTITGISPREASILGGTQITLTGSGFSATASSRPRASGGSALCRMGWNWGGWAFNSTTPPFPLPVPTTQATVLSDTELRCHTPAIANAGLVSVQVSLDGGTSWAGEGVHDQPHLRFFAPFSAAVHRRPYTDEADVRLLLNIHRSVTTRGESLQVSAAHEGKEVLAPTAVIAGRSSNTSFAVALLPARVNGILNVTLHVGGKRFNTQHVRLVRAPMSQSYQPVVAVDYETRGLLVEGMPLLAFGYFTSGDVTGDLKPRIAEMAQLASVGNTMIQLYRLGSMPVAKVLQYLDAAAAQNIYVHLDVCELVSKVVGHNPGQPPANSTAIWQQLKTVVLATRRHPALLAWYIADDTVNWPHDGLRSVYMAIKTWDPYHPASIAMAWAGNALNYRDAFDINMFENYPFKADPGDPTGTSPSHKDFDHPSTPDIDFWTELTLQYPMDWEPAWICGQSFDTETPAQLRSQNYLGYAAGLTGNLNFIHHAPVDAGAFQLQQEAATVNAELQELAPSFLSAREPVDVRITPACWPGSVGDGHQQQSLPAGADPGWVQGAVPCAVAAGFRESVESGGCTTVVIGNKANEPLAVEISLLPLVDYAGMTAAVLFQQRALNFSKDGKLATTLGPLGTMALRLGCTALATGQAAPNATLVKNGGMEEVFYAGQAVGWAQAAVGTAAVLDPRSGAFADTRLPHSGRHSLRVVNPSPQTTALSLGVKLLANTSYHVTLHARCLGSSDGKAVQIVAVAPKPSTMTGVQPDELPVVSHTHTDTHTQT
jgi:hypothetical protein